MTYLYKSNNQLYTLPVSVHVHFPRMINIIALF